MSRLPLIGTTLCSTQTGLDAYHISGDRCVHAKARVARGMPLTLPSPVKARVPSDILDGLRDIFFTGCPSNIEPFSLDDPTEASGFAHDFTRVTTLSMNLAAVRAGVCARQLQWQSLPSDAHASNNA